MDKFTVKITDEAVAVMYGATDIKSRLWNRLL